MELNYWGKHGYYCRWNGLGTPSTLLPVLPANSINYGNESGGAGNVQGQWVKELFSTFTQNLFFRHTSQSSLPTTLYGRCRQTSFLCLCLQNLVGTSLFFECDYFGRLALRLVWFRLVSIQLSYPSWSLPSQLNALDLWWFRPHIGIRHCIPARCCTSEICFRGT